MRIHSLETPSGGTTYYDSAFLNLLEDHLDYLKKLPSNRFYTTTYQLADKYQGDFYGLLDHLQLPKKYHYIVMRVNSLLTSSDYTADQITIIIPDVSEIDLLKAVYDTK